MAADRTTANTVSKEKAGGELRITLRKSTNRRLAKHKACVAGLGLRRIGDEVRLADRPEVRGMVNRVRYLLEVEEIAHSAPPAKSRAKSNADSSARARAIPKPKPSPKPKPKAKATTKATTTANPEATPDALE